MTLSQTTVCTMDCPDACALLVNRGQDGGVDLRGHPDHPVTRGFVCAKIKRHPLRLTSEHRIRSPLIRTDTGFKPISWDDALGRCAATLDRLRDTPEAILHVHGSGAKGVLKMAVAHFFHQLGATSTRGSLCDAAGIIATIRDFGSRENPPLQDLTRSARIVNWGRDYHRASIHTAAMVAKARRSGIQVTTIAPNGKRAVQQSDFAIRLRPGTDRFLAAAVLKLLFEQGLDVDTEQLRHWDGCRSICNASNVDSLLSHCDVSRQDALRLASWYGLEAPVATIIGTGLQRYRFGGQNVRWIDALACLSGHVGRPGAGVHYHLNTYRHLNLDWVRSPRLSPPARRFRLPTLARDIQTADPPVEMIWINGTNPVNQHPDSQATARALAETPLVVVADAFMTDTARQADIILPATLMLEQMDVVGSFLHDTIQYAAQVIPPPEEARSDYEMVLGVNRRLTQPLSMPAPEACLERALSPPGVGVSLGELRRQRWVSAGCTNPPYENRRFAHADGRYRLPTALDPEPNPPPDYPFRLLSLIRSDVIHSQMLPKATDAPPTVWVAAQTLEQLGVSAGGTMVLVSPLGRLVVTVAIDDYLHPEAVVYRRGDWMRHGGGINQLIQAAVTDMGDLAAFYDQWVRLEPIESTACPMDGRKDDNG